MALGKHKYRDVYPQYLPFYYFWYLLIRKAIRQGNLRLHRKFKSHKGPVGIVDDGEGCWYRNNKNGTPNPVDAINKGAFWMEEDLARDDVKGIVVGIEEIKETLKSKKLLYTTTAASFVDRLYSEEKERKNSWENAWVFIHSEVKPEHKVLDIGGASTAFNFYLASVGCSVRIIDNDWNNCGIVYNANHVARQMNWDLKAYNKDAEKRLPFDDNSFDRVFSICVIEHLTSEGRRQLFKEIGRVLKPGGIVGLTTDYNNSRDVMLFDKGLRFGYRDKLNADVINPSGLSLLGNKDLIDFKDEDFFLGAFFLKKD